MIRFFRKKPFLKSFVSLFILLIFVAGTAIFLTRPVKADSLLGFNEGSGSTIHDTSGSATGTISNATWKPTAECISGPCLYFNGTNANVSFGDENTFDFVAATNWTVEGWFKTPTISSGTRMLLSKHNATAGGYKVYLTSDGKMNFAVDDDSSWTPDDVATSQSRYDDNVWHFFAATKTGTASIILYIDGNRVGEKDTLVATGTLANSDNFYIGIDGNGTSNPWLGYIDEIKIIIATANSATQIKSDYQKDSSIRGISSRFGPDAASLNSGMLAWWKMDESSGGPVDSSGNSYTLTNNGTTPFTTGKFANAAGTFNGTTRYFSTASTITGIKTISFWIYPASTTNNYINLRTSTPVNIISTSGVVSTAGFTSPVVYVNGALGGTLTTNSWQFVTVTDTSTTSADAFQIGRVGASSYLSSSSLIDEVRLYNRTLSPSEVSQLANWGPDPVGYYKLDENSGTTAADSSGNGVNGTWAAGGWPHWTTGNFGGAANFTGSNNTNEWITVADGSSNSLYSFTISAWVKTTSANFWVVSKNGSGPGNTLLLVINNGLIEMDAKDGSFSGLNTCVEWDDNSLDNGNWHHVAGSYDSVSGIGSLYVNGNLITNTTGCTGTSTGNYGTGNPLLIGDSGAAGQVDDLKIYKYVRTPAQIVSDMNGSRSSANSPIGQWKFNENYGATANNSGYGSSMNGTLSGATTPSWSNSGKFGSALSFNGTTAYITMGNPSAANFAADFSISAWVNLTTNNAVHDILSKDGNSSNLSYRLYTDASGKLNLEVSSNGTATTTVTGTTTLSTSTWYYVAGTYSPGKSLAVYVNGLNDANNITSIPSSIFKTAGNLEIGSQNGGGTNRMSGLVDEVKLFNYFLTPDQIKTDFNSGGAQRLGSLGTDSSGNASYSTSTNYCIPGDTTSCSSPIAEWKFNENSGTTANDISGNSLTGTWAGTIGQQWLPGKFGSSGNFNGTNNYVDASDNSIFTSLGDMTMEAWVKLHTVPTVKGDSEYIIEKKNSSGTPGWQSFYILVSTTGDKPYVKWTNSSGSDYNATSTYTLVANTWYHIAATKNSSTMKIYVNGVDTTNTSDTPTGTVLDSDSTLRIGSDGTTSSGNLDGQIDEVKIYNYVRTPAQIAWDYNKGAPLAWYRFDECTGSTAFNSAINSNDQAAGNDGTITIAGTGTQTATGTCGTSGAWFNGATGKFNSSLNLDGSDDYIATSNVALIAANTSTYTNVSWGGWFNPGATPTSKTLIHKNNEFRLTTNASNQPQCERYSGSWQTAVTTTSTLPTNSWSHIMCAYDGVFLWLYVNGVATASLPQTNAMTSSSATALNIGRDSAGSGYFNGQVDDIRIYNYSLTPTQIKTLYNNSSAVRF